jgi:hypothetical protein
MKRVQTMKLVRFLAILGIVALLLSPLARGTPEYRKKEDKPCEYCHTAFGKPDLNEVGKCYKDHNHSLKDCAPKK